MLLHGFAETSHMWRPLIAKLSDKHTVIAPDLRGFGQSSSPEGGYTKKAMAQDIHALVKSLKYDRIRLVGHDIGLMVAYAYAAQYPSEVDRIVLMEAFLPGVGEWNNVFLLRDLWHFHFFGKTPLALVTGRERIYLEHFWNDFAADATKSVSEADRKFYAKEYARPGHMKAGMEVFRAFPQDAVEFAGFAKTKLSMPMLVLSGGKAGGPFLIEQGKMVATNVEGVLVKGRGHWLMEEAPDQVIPEAGRISQSLKFDRSFAASLPVCDMSANISRIIQLSLMCLYSRTCLHCRAARDACEIFRLRRNL